jgi:hypothetical protein
MGTPILFAAASEGAMSAWQSTVGPPATDTDTARQCAFVVGDFIKFPTDHSTTYQVVSRRYVAGQEPRWIVGLQIAPSPT